LCKRAKLNTHTTTTTHIHTHTTTQQQHTHTHTHTHTHNLGGGELSVREREEQMYPTAEARGSPMERYRRERMAAGFGKKRIDRKLPRAK